MSDPRWKNFDMLRRLGMIQIEILHCVDLAQREDKAYGLHIAKLMSEESGKFINPAQVFVTLKRLVARELIEQKGIRKEYGTPPMKLYVLTEKGQDVLDMVRQNPVAQWEPKKKPDPET